MRRTVQEHTRSFGVLCLGLLCSMLPFISPAQAQDEFLKMSEESSSCVLNVKIPGDAVQGYLIDVHGLNAEGQPNVKQAGPPGPSGFAKALVIVQDRLVRDGLGEIASAQKNAALWLITVDTRLGGKVVLLGVGHWTSDQGWIDWLDEEGLGAPETTASNVQRHYNLVPRANGSDYVNLHWTAKGDLGSLSLILGFMSGPGFSSPLPPTGQDVWDTGMLLRFGPAPERDFALGMNRFYYVPFDMDTGSPTYPVEPGPGYHLRLTISINSPEAAPGAALFDGITENNVYRVRWIPSQLLTLQELPE